MEMPRWLRHPYVNEKIDALRAEGTLDKAGLFALDRKLIHFYIRVVQIYMVVLFVLVTFTLSPFLLFPGMLCGIFALKLARDKFSISYLNKHVDPDILITKH